LIRVLSIACEFIRHRIVVGSIRIRAWSEMKDRRVKFCVVVPTLMTNESTIVRPKFGAKGAVGIDVSCFTLFIKEVVLSLLYVVAG
jgi:hypothetical protein